jgi:predicted 3-demethylubiquinone-9 3-methyltransferase (glyoxalase superfamily)
MDEYPFSERYGWCSDSYGVSWQMIFTGEREIQQKITPVLLFVGEVYGKTEEAVNSYVSAFDNANVDFLDRYGKDQEPDQEGTIQYASFTLAGQEFAAFDSAHKHDFTFNEAISFYVECENQAEVDYFWERFSAVPEAEQCGWLKDPYGISWQIVPKQLGEFLDDPDREKADRVMRAMLQMKKIDIPTLEQAHRG